MFPQSPIVLTWKSLLKLGAGFAAEYALLSLIEDAPEVVKVATLVTALGALGALESQEWLIRRHRHLFMAAIVVTSVIYLCFIGYALWHVRHESQIDRRLEQFYLAAEPLLEMAHPLAASVTKPSEVAVNRWQKDVTNWKDEVANYLLENVSDYAKARFLNLRGAQWYGCSGWGEVDSVCYDLDTYYKNLGDIRDARARDK